MLSRAFGNLRLLAIRNRGWTAGNALVDPCPRLTDAGANPRASPQLDALGVRVSTRATSRVEDGPIVDDDDDDDVPQVEAKTTEGKPEAVGKNENLIMKISSATIPTRTTTRPR